MWLNDNFTEAIWEKGKSQSPPDLILSWISGEAGQDQDERVWRWQIEPGMQEAFQHLSGWLVPADRDDDARPSGPSLRLARSPCPCFLYP